MKPASKISREIEVKLELPDPKSLIALLDDGQINGYIVKPTALARIRDEYFDTADWRVWRSGFALRRRTEDGASSFTLKSLSQASGSEHDRIEVTQDAGKARTPGGLTAAGEVTARLSLVAGNAPLRPLFALRTERRRFDVLDAAGRSLLEIALDATTVGANGRSRGRFSELEIELLPEGSTTDLESVAAFLQTTLSLQCSRPKFERGLAFASLHPRSFLDLGSREIHATSSARDASVAVLRGFMARMLQEEGGTRLGEDSEALHRMRVAVRRARSLLRLSREILPPRSAELVRSELRWVGAFLGEVRDFDVAIEHIESQKEIGEARSLMRDHLLQRRAQARTRMLRALNSRRYEVLVARIRRLLAPGSGKYRAGPQRIPHGDYFSLSAGGALGSALSQARKINPASDTAEVHDLRIKLKRLRYCLEAFPDLFTQPGKRTVRQTVLLQDRLGELQNAVIRKQQVSEFALSSSRVRGRSLLLALGGLIEEEEQAIRRGVEEAPAAVRDFTRNQDVKRLRRRLKKVTAAAVPAVQPVAG